ncbi:aldehyde ferredoxin oxidoreductase family protein [Haloplanus halobius]|uniref:aldehyde ferredoxin oxidoreductase family protein n=1 Tax=Haloplanus halobius TaxID=2934938 RepID=UPI00200C8E79|nr:aldehyde ferredoxin oxidoreductase C-terminal domain-containing protein [Haloplanus sp. XH21]
MRHAIGSLLSVDVGSRTIMTESIDDVLERYIGGRGVGTRLAHDRLPFETPPLSPDNALFFTTGPMQVSNMSFTGRMNCTGISPLTDGLLSSNAGGFLSRNFAATGYSAVEITDRSEELVIVHVTDEGVDFEEVSQLEGATIPETDEYLKETHGLDSDHVAAIGPAGENEVRYAAIMTSESRAFGRGGLGAVLGSKNVKAITFDGDSPPEIPIDEEAQQTVHRQAATSDHVMKRQGTTSVTELANEINGMPTRYYSEQSFEDISLVSGDRVEEKKYKKGTCSACAFACKLPTRDEEREVETEGPEFETLYAFGPNSGVNDIVDIMQSNELCDRFGLDTISCGNSIAAYLAANDEFGNANLIHELVEKIAHRDGIGDTLAEGIGRFHDVIGVENWTVKNMEFAGHEGRTLNGTGLAYATANRGADHMYGSFYELEYPLVDADEAVDNVGLDGKPERLIEKENFNGVLDSAILCKFSRNSDTKSLLGTLLDAEAEELLDVGERIVTLERHFNSKRGFDRSDDTLPYDLSGFEAALDEYYDRRGWNDDGTVPDVKVPSH